jgi:putative component of membrane protein insertase Oxa1/YidC/SpoIIIJ protein YidD
VKVTELTVWRLLSCAPWNQGVVDEVPPARTHRNASPDGSRADPRTRPAENHEEQAPC